MPVFFDPSEEVYPPDGASLEDVARAFVDAVAQTRVVTNETIHRWGDAFEQALPPLKDSDEPASSRNRW